MNFLFYLFFIGILIGSIQDLKRREVDNYVNFFLLASGLSFLFFSSVVSGNYYIFLFGLMAFVIMFVLANIFYYSRVFAGGDAKLMIALSALFAGFTLKETLVNIGSFIVFLLLAGAIYGLIYSIILFSVNFSKIKKDLNFRNYWIYLSFGCFVFLMILGLFDFIFIFFAVFILVMPFLFLLAKSIEKHALTKKIKASELREGDWIVNPLKVGKKVIYPNWEGLTKNDLISLKKYKALVEVKDGIAFVPAFLIAFLFYIFLKSYLVLLI